MLKVRRMHVDIPASRVLGKWQDLFCSVDLDINISKYSKYDQQKYEMRHNPVWLLSLHTQHICSHHVFTFNITREEYEDVSGVHLELFSIVT